jgi:outer membrane protein TolC
LPPSSTRLPHRPAPTIAFALLALAGAPSAVAQISFYTAVDLALRNSHEVKLATADVERAAAGLAQARDAYIPNLVVGSSLGYSYGFPVGQPSIYNVSSNSLVFSFSQPDAVRSAHASVDATRASLRDAREKVVADVATQYIELDVATRELAAIEQQYGYGERLAEIERQRSAAGLSSAMDVTQADLIDAQLELRRLHLQDHIASLRLHLANLTGLTEDAVETEPASIPNAPAVPATQQLLAEITARNPALAASAAEAASKRFLARSDQRRLQRPEAAFGIQYSRYARFNNYADYYLRFQHNNFDVGINMSLPLFDASARDRARGSAADAVHAREQNMLARVQLSEQARELAGTLAELRAQQKVARLQSDYAQESVDAVVTQLQNGSGNPNAPQLTPRDEQKARVEERRRYVDKLEADLQLVEAQIQLERSRGDLEEWARKAPQQ